MNTENLDFSPEGVTSRIYSTLHNNVENFILNSIDETVGRGFLDSENVLSVETGDGAGWHHFCCLAYLIKKDEEGRNRLYILLQDFNPTTKRADGKYAIWCVVRKEETYGLFFPDERQSEMLRQNFAELMEDTEEKEQGVIDTEKLDFSTNGIDAEIYPTTGNGVEKYILPFVDIKSGKGILDPGNIIFVGVKDIDRYLPFACGAYLIKKDEAGKDRLYVFLIEYDPQTKRYGRNAIFCVVQNGETYGMFFPDKQQDATVREEFGQLIQNRSKNNENSAKKKGKRSVGSVLLFILSIPFRIIWWFLKGLGSMIKILFNK